MPDRVLKMIRQPDVIVVEIGNIFAFTAADAFIVWLALIPGVLRKVIPVHPWIVTVGMNDVFSVIGTAIADDPQLKVAIGLP